MPSRKIERHLIEPRKSGNLLPLICIHGDDANRLLPDLIHPHRPFGAFKHQGEGGAPIRLKRIVAIATGFLKELTDAGWKPPYILCGYSFGGLVAFEMAQQLRAVDPTSVPLLILIDSYAPRLHEQAMSADRTFLANIRDRLFDMAVKPYVTGKKRMPPKLHHHHIIATYDAAIRAYAPQPYSGRALLIRSSDGWGPEDMGWHGLMHGGLMATLVPGDHFNIIKPPQIEAVAKVIEEHACVVEETARS